MSNYNEKTVVDGREIILTEEEKAWTERFHLSRLAFAFLEDGTCAINLNDVREHKVYLQEDFDVSEERFQQLKRGYIIPGRIVFYKTLSFIPVDEIYDYELETVSNYAKQVFGPGSYEVWNGVQIKELFTDWPPIDIVKTIEL